MSERIYTIKTSASIFRNYCYLVVDESSRNAALIDPAWNPGLIKGVIENYEIKLNAVLITHAHPDHTNLAEHFARLYDAPVYMSVDEIRSTGFSCVNLRSFEDGETLQIGEMFIKCIVTPGHTRGSACFLSEAGLFTGDTAFIEGCGMCVAYEGSLTDMFNSIQRLKKLIPRHVGVYPGHKYASEPGATFETICTNNIYFCLKNQEQFNKFRTRRGQRNMFSFQ